MEEFKLVSDYKPTGDQPQAIEQLVADVERGRRYNTLLGVTGSGKTFTIANVVAQLNRPTLVLCHNKTLAAQLYSEFKNFFPDNAVEYYVSYYDYYQPEAYLPTTGTYIEKDLSINDEIEKMRLSTTTTLLSGRRDVIVVASVSCIYGIGNPEDFKNTSISLVVGEICSRKVFLFRLTEALYTRTEREMTPGTFRVNGDSIDIMSAYGNDCYRVELFDDEIESIDIIDPTAGHRISRLGRVTIYPANLFVTTQERISRAVGLIYVDMGKQVEAFEASGRMQEAQRLKQRVEYDLEMIKELSYCSGIENYSRYFDGRKPGQAPFCLLDYFPEDFLTVVDESHVTIPQIRGMYGGDRARKENLVEYGFRLEAAKDNRPLTFDEYNLKIQRTIFVSATPSDYERTICDDKLVEQLIRPTGLIDPPMEIREAEMQIDDMVEGIRCCERNGERVIVTTITKRMAEELSRYFDKIGIRNRYIHSDVDTIERVQILDDLRKGLFDVLVGVNLLREGIDLAEVSLVVILDADKEGFLRNGRSLTQMAGRAARNAMGLAVLYANVCTDSMADAIIIANRQRMIQVRYNVANSQMPRRADRSGASNQLLASRPTEETLTIVNYAKPEEHYQQVAEPIAIYTPESSATTQSYRKRGVVDYKTGRVRYADETVIPDVLKPEIDNIDELMALETQKMEAAAKELDFTSAAKHRDNIYELVKRRDMKLNEFRK